jgi:hypothetical protein
MVGGTMGPGMFDGILETLIAIGIVIGLSIAVITWALTVYVFPHIHFSWS